METGEISRKLKRGKHTTRRSQLIRVGDDTFLCDTPGFTSLYVEEMDKEELRHYFREFVPYEDSAGSRAASISMSRAVPSRKLWKKAGSAGADMRITQNFMRS